METEGVNYGSVEELASSYLPYSTASSGTNGMATLIDEELSRDNRNEPER